VSASWYDVLGVDRSASAEEIREVWKKAIADLDPTDRRFRACNQAAEVLLDPTRRAEYDAELGPEAEPETIFDEPDEPETIVDEPDESAFLIKPGPEYEPGAADDSSPPTVAPPGGPWLVPTWLLVAMASATLVLLAASLLAVKAGDVDVEPFAWVRGDESVSVEDSADEARQAAEKSVPLVLSYDYRTLDRDHDRAVRVLTGEQLDDYERNWTDGIAPNAAKVKAVVETSIAESGVGLSSISEDGNHVELLVVVDSQTRNVKVTNRQTLGLTVVMVRSGGEWLIEDLKSD
jgi:Mce-associated membrane protein